MLILSSSLLDPRALGQSSLRRGILRTALSLVLVLGCVPWLAAQVPAMPEDPPEIEDDFYAVDSSTTSLRVRHGVLENDTLPSHHVEVRVIRPPVQGALLRWNPEDGTFVYKVGKDWSGTDRFEYEVRAEDHTLGKGIVTIGTAYKGYTYYVDGHHDEQASPHRSAGGLMLIGGHERKPELDDAYVWLIQHINGNAPADGKDAKGGTILVITGRKERAERTASWIRHTAEEHHLRLRCVEAIVFDATDGPAARQAARTDPFIRQRLQEADAIFMPGGDQRTYLELWKGTMVTDILNRRMQQGNVIVAGSSAGLHALGDGICAPLLRHDVPANTVSGTRGVTSRQALENLQHLAGMLEWDFLYAGCLHQQHVIMDSHFCQRNSSETDPNLRGRMGRLVAFMALARASRRCPTVHGLGIEETTALLVESDGKASVVGQGSAYFVNEGVDLRPGMQDKGLAPFAWDRIKVQKVNPGGAFDLQRWQALASAESYSISVRNGRLRHDADPSLDVYNNHH